MSDCERKESTSERVDEHYVLDTSAVFALTDKEAGWRKVGELLRRARDGDIVLTACSVTLMEVFYISLQEAGEDAAASLLALVKSWPLTWFYPEEEELLVAGRFKAFHRLSFADALIAAVARTQRATLVHKDPELAALSGQVALLSLPFKGS